MARRRRGKRGHRSHKIPILSLAILGGQVALAVAEAGGPNLYALDRFQDKYTGFSIQNKDFNPARLAVGYGPWLVKGLAMKFARPLGAAPRVPFGLPISLS